MAKAFWYGLTILGFIWLSQSSCKHSFDDLIVDPVDTTMNPIDTIVPCDSNIVYFELQVLPILISNCAQSGCHDVITHEEGIILTSYEQMLKSKVVKPFDLNSSELYKFINERDIKKRMPPPPQISLTVAQKNLISQWISQGAKNETCDFNKNSCDTLNIGFSKNIVPILDLNCKTCHSDPASGVGVLLTGYTQVVPYAKSGKLSCVINQFTYCKPMPLGGKKLKDCDIRTIEIWIKNGALNN